MDGDSTWGWEGEGARRLCRPRMAWATQAFDPSLWDLKPGQSFLQMQTYLSLPTTSSAISTLSPIAHSAPCLATCKPGKREARIDLPHLPSGFFRGTWRFKGLRKAIHPL